MPNKKHTEGSIYIDFSETNIANDARKKEDAIKNLIESLKSKNSQFTADYSYQNQSNYADFYIDFTASQNSSFKEKIKELLNPIERPTMLSTLLQSIPNLKIEINYREENNLSINTNKYGKAVISKEN